MITNPAKYICNRLHRGVNISSRSLYNRLVYIGFIAIYLWICSSVTALEDGQVKKRDTNEDGVIDQVAEFNHQGVMVLLKIDDNGDGLMDTFQYYVGGEMVRLEKDLDTVPGIDLRDYFKDGKKIRQERLDDKGHIFQEIHLDAAGEPIEIREDTTANQRMDTVYTIEEGQITHITRDENDNGVTNIVELYRNGKLVETRRDANGDGKVEEQLLFNEEGLLDRRHLDTDMDGDLDMLEIFRSGLTHMQQWDQDQDGLYERVAFFEKGDMLRIEEDSDMDGRMDTFQRYKNNRLVFVEKDTNADGEIDTKISYDAGKQKNALMDQDYDGRFETTHWYDRPPWTRVTELDSNGNGNVDVCSYYKNDILRRRETLKKGFQLVELRENFDEKGFLVSSQEDGDADGRWDITWYYNTQGKVERAEKDANADERVDIWYYYESGQLSQVSEDANGDGQPDIWEVYDASESMIQRKKDLDFDGVADIEETF